MPVSVKTAVSNPTTFEITALSLAIVTVGLTVSIYADFASATLSVPAISLIFALITFSPSPALNVFSITIGLTNAVSEVVQLLGSVLPSQILYA